MTTVLLIIGTAFIALFYYLIYTPLKFIFDALEKSLEEKDEDYD